MSIFGQVWLWSALAFVVGALLTWLVLVRPAQARVKELERELDSERRDAERRDAERREAEHRNAVRSPGLGTAGAVAGGAVAGGALTAGAVTAGGTRFDEPIGTAGPEESVAQPDPWGQAPEGAGSTQYISRTDYLDSDSSGGIGMGILDPDQAREEPSGAYSTPDSYVPGAYAPEDTTGSPESYAPGGQERSVPEESESERTQYIRPAVPPTDALPTYGDAGSPAEVEDSRERLPEQDAGVPADEESGSQEPYAAERTEYLDPARYEQPSFFDGEPDVAPGGSPQHAQAEPADAEYEPLPMDRGAGLFQSEDLREQPEPQQYEPQPYEPQPYEPQQPEPQQYEPQQYEQHFDPRQPEPQPFEQPEPQRQYESEQSSLEAEPAMTEAITPPPLPQRHARHAEDAPPGIPIRRPEPEPEPEPEETSGGLGSEPESTQVLPKRQPRQSQMDRFQMPKPFHGPPSMQPTQPRTPPPPPAQPERTRSLFEPVVPAAGEDEADTPEPPPARQQPEGTPNGPFGPGSAMPRPGGGSPSEEFVVKASVTALRYCTPASPQYPQMVAEVWFRSPADAERVGFSALG
ncbi:hypothetical protein CFN78_00780 [Amycolatopsis antarctica]|uniref:Uncharacterized protein n=1 Tax=Amycolatopsis antarctica TaxID=1854586 RepID=A0A263D8L4_9PSEU|nr:hypothetical protein CFN78_00780 [Amycolatopsis antarctica]